MHYSTYLGGSDYDFGNGIAVDGSGNAYVTGETGSADFPTVNAKYPNLWGGQDAFVFKLSSDGQTVQYSTYLGGGSYDSGYGIAVDGSGNAYVTGGTGSADFPTVNAWDDTFGEGLSDAFVTKINLAVTNTPEQPVYSPPPQTVVAQPGKSKNLVLLIHGWNSNPATWADGMKQSIANQLPGYVSGSDPCTLAVETDTATWQICTYDWSKAAGYNPWNPPGIADLSPWDAYVNAIDEGKWIAKYIVDKKFNYDFIHFIAHSAGSQVADTAATWLKLQTPEIHTTFLDAFDPRGSGSPYGKDSTWAEQYVDSRPVGTMMAGDLDATNIILPNAYNFDVTALDPDTSPNILGLHAHAWPYEWYQFTVDNKTIFNYGFALSLESGIGQLPSYADWPKGHRCSFSSVIDKTCSETESAPTVDVKIICSDLWSCYTTDINALIKSDTGTVSLPASGHVNLLNGSPVWVGLPVELAEPANFVDFDYEFLRQAEGLLSVFFDGQLVFRADQRVAPSGVNNSGRVSIGEITGGSHTLFYAYPVDATSVSFGWRHSPRYKLSYVGASIRTPIPSTELNAVIG